MKQYNNNLRIRLTATSLAIIGLTTQAANVWAFSPSTKPAETQSVPGNMLLALSVEFPTGLQVSYSSNYSSTTLYDGYFDNRKCYSYDTANEVFVPESGKKTDNACPDANHWSGNVLNWLTMTNLDQFRSVMTGGARDNFSSMNATHPGDTSGTGARTVLIRSLSDRNSYFGDKTLNSAWPGVPATYNGRKARSGGNGSKFYIHNTAGSNPSNNGDMATRLKKCSDSAIANHECFNARVEVCKEVPATASSTAVGREENCFGPYGISPNTYYKPQGLIQEYSNSIRFGAMGYLNDSSKARNGGVLRAKMKSVGSIKIGENGATNTENEWSTDGTLILNPDSTDASSSGVSQSGVINYLNKFGYTSGYKGYDPVGELYYAAQRYFRNIGFPSDYTNLGTDAAVAASLKDGFPVITSPADPIIKSCQKNFILGLGDIYTHCDNNLPGSTIGNSSSVDGCSTGTATDPAGLNVTSLTSSVSSMEGNPSWLGGASAKNQFMAGLAWWANVNDIRSDLGGKQTIATYWVDVLENNNGGSGIGAKSQFWGAAKYGGFRQELTSNSTNPNDEVTSWDKDGNGQPDTLFAGNNPQALKSGLRSAFADILARADDSSASSAAVTSNRQTSSSQIIYAGYNPKDWTGAVRACSPSQNSAQCDSSPAWEASRWFNASYTAGATPKLTDSTRKIITSVNDAGTFSKSAFQWSSLNTTQQAALNGGDSDGSDRVSYLRGSRTHESSKFRKRGVSLMGDIVNSNVTYLSGSGPLLKGSNFPGHATYRTSNATRSSVVYVGANDGMLHAFSGSTGKELWAYIPGAIYSNLPDLTSPSYTHQYYVDATAMVGDTETGSSTTPWRTMLVGGLGGGGKGYYALDISRQTPNSSGDSFANMSESQIANIPMWEFTASQDSDLGYTFYEPSIDSITGRFNQIAKVADATTSSGVWRAILNNGYGSTGNNAILFFLNTESGAVSTKLTATSTGTGDNGLSSPSPVDTDNDGLVDTVYAGDLRGRLHKFQFSKLSGTDYILANSGDSTAAWRYIGAVYEAAKPITAAPVVTKACTGSTGWQVLFGTGKLNENSDFTNTDTNSFYNVLDEGISSSLTVSSANLATITPTTSTVSAGTVRNWTTPNLASKKGWKLDLPSSERIISNPSLPPDTGAVLFGTAKPSGDLCQPGSSGFLMAVKVCTGAIGELLIGSTVVGGYGVSASGILKVSNSYTNGNNKETVVCNQADCQNTPATLNSAGAPGGRYSWKKILTR